MAASARFRAYLLKQARQNLATDNYDTAFAHYLLAVKIDHELSGEIQEEFVSCMCHWTDLLNSTGQNDRVSVAFSQARVVCAFSDTLMCAIGEQALRLERYNTAVRLIQEAEQSFPQSMCVRKTWEHVAYGAVERWHFKMLNDIQRNKAYHDAIRLTVQKYNVSSVLDIGCGTGLLSLFADMGGAQNVTMCDAALVMTEVCSAVVDSYRHQNQSESSRLRILHEASTSLSVPKDIPEKVDLVVTEIFDAALFGEHCLFSLSHAWKHLISNSTHRGGRVIPGSAQLYVCAIECTEIRKENWVDPANVPLLDLSGVSIVCKTSLTEEEPYTTEDLYSVKDSYRFLSPIQALLAVDFNDPQNLDSLSSHCADFMLDVYAEGRVDALAVWFDLDLCEGVKVSTAPSPTCCWEQAVFPVMVIPSGSKLQDMTGVQPSPKVNCGDQLKISCTLTDGCLRLALREIVALGYFMNTCHISPQSHNSIGTAATALELEDKARDISTQPPLTAANRHDMDCLERVESPSHADYPSGTAASVLELKDKARDISTQPSLTAVNRHDMDCLERVESPSLADNPSGTAASALELEDKARDISTQPSLTAANRQGMECLERAEPPSHADNSSGTAASTTDGHIPAQPLVIAANPSLTGDGQDMDVDQEYLEGGFPRHADNANGTAATVIEDRDISAQPLVSGDTPNATAVAAEDYNISDQPSDNADHPADAAGDRDISTQASLTAAKPSCTEGVIEDKHISTEPSVISNTPSATGYGQDMDVDQVCLEKAESSYETEQGKVSTSMEEESVKVYEGNHLQTHIPGMKFCDGSRLDTNKPTMPLNSSLFASKSQIPGDLSHLSNGEQQIQTSSLSQEKDCILVNGLLPVDACASALPGLNKMNPKHKDIHSHTTDRLKAKGQDCGDTETLAHRTDSVNMNEAGCDISNSCVSNVTQCSADAKKQSCAELMSLGEDCHLCLRNEKDTTDSSDCTHSAVHPSSYNFQNHQHPQKTTSPDNHTHNTAHSNTFFLQREEIRHLNDSKVNSLNLSALKWAKNKTHTTHQTRMIHISSRFPLCGLLALRSGFKKVDLCYTGIHDKREMAGLAARLAQRCSVRRGGWAWREGSVEGVVEGYDGGDQLDVVSIDVMETEGCLRARLMDELRVLRPVVSVNAVVSPQTVDVYAVLIDSPQLQTMSQVTSDDNTLGISIVPHINLFQTRTFLDLDIHALPHRNISDVVHVFRLDIQSCLTGETTTLPPNQPSNASATPKILDTDWEKHLNSVFSQCKQLRMKVCKSGNATALAFWFDLSLAPGANLSTVDPQTNWRQAAYMLYGGRVTEWQEVVVEARLEKSYLHFSLC